MLSVAVDRLGASVGRKTHQVGGIRGTGLWGWWGTAAYRVSGAGAGRMASCRAPRHAVGPFSPSGEGTGSPGCTEAPAHSSLCTSLMLPREGRPISYPALGHGGVWAAGGWATYLSGVACSPEPPPIPKDVAGSRIPEKGQTWPTTRTGGMSHQSNLGRAVGPKVTQ